MAGSYAAALLPRRSRGEAPPDRVLELDSAPTDPARLAEYCRLCGFVLDGNLPSPFPHLLGFPLQARLMAAGDFPFRLPGLVHLRQRIEQRRPIGAGEAPSVAVRAERLRAHRRGACIDLVTELWAAGEPVWRGRSTYLAKGAAAPGVPVEPAPPPEVPPGHPVARWRVEAETARRYARVSGDMNPIHLNPAAARLFGFPGTIAHGMWAAARCAGTVAGRLPPAHALDVTFRKPVRLPGTVELASAHDADEWRLALRMAGSDQASVVATARPFRT
ncbi:MaoC/PaaZ C-terminal domain-containing protein [Pseudonocardia eucalypti]|uniref:MaoC/PaaZ C-terminal domain-containing protein n=1 Tax=Pseudonocardia eucalypti TaxID=648755 RepID=A0ABP9QRC1_9PSEU